MTTLWVILVIVAAIVFGLSPIYFAVRFDWARDGGYHKYTLSTGNLCFGSLVSVLAGMATFGLCCWILAWTTGFAPHYGKGTIEGYINHAGVYGAVYKTNEFDMQVENDKQTALQHFRFSAPNKNVNKLLLSSVGKKVVIWYSEWLIMPYRMGVTNREATGISTKFVPESF